MSTANASFVVNNFGLYRLGDGCTAIAQAIKTQNPSVKLLYYWEAIGAGVGQPDWSTINANEAWFMHDVNGGRISENTNGWLLMNISNSAYQAHWVSEVKSLINNAYYDGVFADDVWNVMRPSDFNATIPASAVSSWHSNMISFLQYIKANLPSGKLLIINTDEWATHDYLNIADGKMDEGFAHANWEGAGVYDNRIPQILDALARDSATRKIVWCASGTTETGPTKVTNTVKYCYAAFLCAVNGSQAYLGFNNWLSPDGSHGYYPILSINIGMAQGSYYYSQNVFMRDFTHGKALLNPSGNSYNVNLGGNYRLLNGTAVSNIILGPWGGEVLSS
jgi:hypothetical protein